MPLFNQYHYEPLCREDAVRLILLNPAKYQTAPLRCSITQHCRSTQLEDYAAVSYAWGRCELSRTLEIGWDDVSYLRITPNVDALLRVLRTPNEPRYLWIDAICLNQDDETEKAQQIPRMRRIYAEAKEVHIWPGLEDDMTAKLFTFFRKANQLREAKQQEMASRMAHPMRKVLHDKYDGSGPRTIVNFFNRPWFSRRWVIQEACLANRGTVHCGKYSIPLPVVTLAAARFQSLDMSSYTIKMATNLGLSTAELSLLDLVWTFHEADCLEPKDRIAALLGLLPLEQPFHLDYAVHWTELYKQAASSILEHGDNNTKLQMMLHLIEFG
ncbi:heterokaryon incompatibility protein-domain-containing protein, partial [Coniochaeta sp. 2T2.1]